MHYVFWTMEQSIPLFALFIQDQFTVNEDYQSFRELD